MLSMIGSSHTNRLSEYLFFYLSVLASYIYAPQENTVIS